MEVGGVDGEAALAAMIAGLDPDDVADLLVQAALEHDDVARAVRLAAADDGDRLQVLRQAVDRTCARAGSSTTGRRRAGPPTPRRSSTRCARRPNGGSPRSSWR